MHLFRRSAAFLIPLLAIISVICTGEAWAQSALGVGVRIKQEFFTPLVPKTTALRKCFQMSPSGTFTMGLCPQKPGESPGAPTRLPANTGAPGETSNSTTPFKPLPPRR